LKEETMAPQSFQLVMRSGPNPGKTFELNKGELTIGRDINNDIVINDAEISRKHARLVAQAGGFILEDLGSTNGTFVNGQRLMGPHPLRSGELILLGENVSLAYEPLHYDADATMMASSGAPVMPEPSPAPMSREPYIPPSRPEPAPSPRPAPQPAYSGSIPPGPVEAYPVSEEERKPRTWIYVGCGCLAIILCVLIVAAVAFDTLNLYCTPPFDLIFTCP
jgi:predicted component of type VI protein secretion system